MSQDNSAKFKALQLPFLCFYKVCKNMASDVLISPGYVPHPHSHLDFPFLCPKCCWPTLFVFFSLHFLLWCSGKILCLVLRGHSIWTAPASSGFILDPLHLSAANWVIKNFPPHTHPTVPAAVLLSLSPSNTSIHLWEQHHLFCTSQIIYFFSLLQEFSISL